MRLVEDRLRRWVLALLPACILIFGVCASLLPEDLQDVVALFITVLAGWLALSVPVGVFIGHCVLRDLDRSR